MNPFTTAKPPADSASSTRIGPYTLHEVIGQGGMAVIYRASQPSVSRDVAIKMIAGNYAAKPAVIQRFEQEIHATAALQHPHIVPVYDAGSDRGQLYIVMAYLPGGSLGRRIASSPAGIPLEDAVCILSQIASALDYAHSQGVIHRDIKPGNILLDSRKNSYLSDFGVAQLNGIQHGPAHGTFAYMAPEIASGEPASPASDIYALGVVLFEMLTGQRPFEAHTREAVLAAHAEPATHSIRQHRPDLPPGLQVVVSQALLSDPAARPPYASSLASALLRASGLRGLPCIEADLDERSPLLAPVHLEDGVWDYDPGTPVPDAMPERIAFEGPITPPPYSMQPIVVDPADPLPDTAVSLQTGTYAPEAMPPLSDEEQSIPQWVWIVVLIGLGACLLMLAGAVLALLLDGSLF